MVKIFSDSYGPRSSLPCSQQPVTGPYPMPDESTQPLPFTFLSAALQWSLNCNCYELRQ